MENIYLGLKLWLVIKNTDDLKGCDSDNDYLCNARNYFSRYYHGNVTHFSSFFAL